MLHFCCIFINQPFSTTKKHHNQRKNVGQKNFFFLVIPPLYNHFTFTLKHVACCSAKYMYEKIIYDCLWRKCVCSWMFSRMCCKCLFLPWELSSKIFVSIYKIILTSFPLPKQQWLGTSNRAKFITWEVLYLDMFMRWWYARKIVSEIFHLQDAFELFMKFI